MVKCAANDLYLVLGWCRCYWRSLSRLVLVDKINFLAAQSYRACALVLAALAASLAQTPNANAYAMGRPHPHAWLSSSTRAAHGAARCGGAPRPNAPTPTGAHFFALALRSSLSLVF